MAVNFVLDSVEPNFGSYDTFQAMGAPVFDSLVEITPGGRMKPGIAERWEISADGRTYTFYVRTGIKFQDGSDLTAADAKFSIERIYRLMPPTATRPSGQA